MKTSITGKLGPAFERRRNRQYCIALGGMLAANADPRDTRHHTLSDVEVEVVQAAIDKLDSTTVHVPSETFAYIDLGV